MTKDGRVKVLDFGIARLREGMSRDVKTHTGTTLGTVAYMAPEQAKGGEIDARADIYAMGATMFRLLAGRRVHEADTEAERLAKLMSGAAEPLSTVAPSVPAAVGAIVDRALAFDRTKRYPDATAMQADVRAAAKGVPAPEATITSAREMPSSVAEPTREATTRVESAPVEAVTKREGPAPADDAATVKTESTRTPEILRTERMPGAPARAPLAPGPAPAGTRATSRTAAWVFAPQNRLLVLLLVGGGVALVVLLIVAVVALRQPSASGSPESPAASDSAGASQQPAAAGPPSTQETATPTHAPTHVPPPSPKGKPHGH
jgi:serine/threonine-protein kinase